MALWEEPVVLFVPHAAACPVLHAIKLCTYNMPTILINPTKLKAAFVTSKAAAVTLGVHRELFGRFPVPQPSGALLGETPSNRAQDPSPYFPHVSTACPDDSQCGRT